MGFQLPASKANLNDICPSYVAHALSIADTLGSITGLVSAVYQAVGTMLWVLGILCPAWFNEEKY